MVITTQEKATQTMQAALRVDASGRFLFACRKAVVIIKIRGRSRPFVFSPGDKVAFRISSDALVIETLQQFRARKQVLWDEVESVSAGDPETDNGSLFQG